MLIDDAVSIKWSCDTWNCTWLLSKSTATGGCVCRLACTDNTEGNLLDVHGHFDITDLII